MKKTGKEYYWSNQILKMFCIINFYPLFIKISFAKKWTKQSFCDATAIFRQIFSSRERPVEHFYWMSSRFQWTSNRNFTGCLVEIFIAFLDEIGNSKSIEANLQNSRGRLVKSYWMSSRIQWTSNRNSTGRPLDQMIWAIVLQFNF